jgi:hypothetical protein
MVIGLGGMPAWAAEYRLDGSVARYQWVEEATPRDVKESGPVLQLGGYVTGFPSEADPTLTLRGDVHLLVGRVNFDTAVLTSPGTPVATHTVYVGTSQEGSLGKRISGERGFVEPFIGLAHRWWLRHIESTGTVAGYPEWYRTLYARLGVRWNANLSTHAGVFGVLSVDPMLFAREQIDWTNTIYNQTLRVRNGKRPGWTVEAGLRQGTVDVSVYWQATRFGESNVVSCNVPPSFLCAQPQSDQDIIGLKVGAQF